MGLTFYCGKTANKKVAASDECYAGNNRRCDRVVREHIFEDVKVKVRQRNILGWNNK